MISIETKYETEQAVSEDILKYPQNTANLVTLPMYLNSYSDHSLQAKQSHTFIASRSDNMVIDCIDYILDNEYLNYN